MRKLTLPALPLPTLALPTLGAALLIATAAAGMATAASPTPAKSATSGYQVYTQAAYDAAKGQQRVLFFHATWCPTCRGADRDIVKNLARLPKNVVIFKTDYDKEVALKKQYGITYQHTFVLVDQDGRALKKWAGGGFEDIVTNAADAKKM
ncbi:thioredoxin family protein [Deinococcus sp.]|uniref:thioredoxin family protein n=1 Tax=Deinococcus sp. TaxID=47478 RepID=UPI0028699B7A|nr:thioredoxin family protein [Deinococcus sp.]